MTAQNNLEVLHRLQRAHDVIELGWDLYNMYLDRGDIEKAAIYLRDNRLRIDLLNEGFELRTDADAPAYLPAGQFLVVRSIWGAER